MKKIAIALTALAGITFLSGCVSWYSPYYGWNYGYNRYAWGYGNGPYYSRFGWPYYGGRLAYSGWDCVHNINAPTHCV